MIRIGEKYIRGSEAKAIEPHSTDPANWSVVLIGGDWVNVNAPAAVVADRVDADEINDGDPATEVLCTLPAGYRPSRKSILSMGTVVLVVEPDGNIYPGGDFHG